ncbi:MAG TPA: ABC transporter permease, partial [Opitutaceae bacterium]|nr:ABC transporter permease [Opitutaceae bacterium]
RDLWRYRELLFFLAWRDIKVRYKQAVLGIVWTVVQPLVPMVVFTFVFSNLAHMDGGNVPYPLVVLAGLIPWQLFSSALSGASGSLISNANLISKVFFPRLITPLSALAVAIVDFGIVLLIYACFACAYHVTPTWRIIFLPGFTAIVLVLAFGAGLWLSALTVKYRDFRFITPFLLQFGIYATPVGYRTDTLRTWASLLELNPLTGIINGFRWCLLAGDSQLTVASLYSACIGAVFFLVTGLWYFRKTERQFADVI